jgi:hypothetical protein
MEMEDAGVCRACCESGCSAAGGVALIAMGPVMLLMLMILLRMAVARGLGQCSRPSGRVTEVGGMA